MIERGAQIVGWGLMAGGIGTLVWSGFKTKDAVDATMDRRAEAFEKPPLSLQMNEESGIDDAESLVARAAIMLLLGSGLLILASRYARR